MSKPWRLLSVLAAAPIIFSFWMSQHLYVNVPYLDDWILFPLAGKIKTGIWPLAESWLLHNEHRLFFHKLILAAWAAWTSWDFRLLPFAHFLMIGSGAWAVSSLIDEKKASVRRSLAFIVVSEAVFSLRAVKVSVWVTMFSVYTSAALSVMALIYLAKNPGAANRWRVASGWAVIGTFTFGSGVFIWPAALPALLASRPHKSFKINAAVWLGASLISYTAYFLGYTVPAHHPALSAGLSEKAQFFLYYLGSLFHPFDPRFFGALGFILWLGEGVLLYKNRRTDAFFLGFLSVGLFVLLNAAATAHARASYGAFYGASDRYVPTSCWFWGVLLIGLFFKDKNSPGRLVSISLAVILSAAIFVSLPAQCEAFKKSRSYLIEIRQFLSQPSLTGEDLNALYPFSEVTEEAFPVFKQMDPVRLKA